MNASLATARLADVLPYLANRLFPLLVATTFVAIVGHSARADDESYSELVRRVHELEAQVEKLETRDRVERFETARIDRTIDAIARDAERRSQLLLQSGATAGYRNGFFISSDDGNFRFHPSLLFQFRGVSNTNDTDSQSGFEVRRTRLRLDGHLFSPDLTYGLIWDTARQGGAVSLLDAWAAYRFAPDWQFKIGQFRESWFHEWDVAPQNQLTAERSLVAQEVGGNLTDRVQGLSLTYGGVGTNPIRVEVALHDGANSQNTDFRDNVGLTANAANFGVGGRFEYRIAGDWSSYADFSARENKQPLLVLGGGFDFTQRGDLDTTLATVDATFETATGWCLYASATGKFADTAQGQRRDYGFLAQAGYLLTPEWEAFARYDVLFPDGDEAGPSQYAEITVGVNRYLGPGGSAGHRAKITLDAGCLPDGAPSNLTGIGAIAGHERQFIIRAQFQLQI
ncbi:porin [Humisphaera borealis]|uniref:Porin n=1 Tax=Humisphaera borealis TaxID=2807512 RepID=A0A7M2WXD1_9BACT|nr:porin [Humisphaera borealis]QOV89471.1 hypothetical protein IPV69_25285 [Humisphaera borealis]